MRARGTATFASSGATRGILWMLLTMFFFVTTNAIAKDLGQRYPVLEMTWVRVVIQALLLMLILRGRYFRALATPRMGLQLVRSSLTIGATISMFAAVQFLPLADSSALLYTSPLMIVALSAPLLGERVGARRWAGVVVGFLGALIVIRPGLGVADAAALLPLAAAACQAFFEMSTRALSRTDATVTTVAYTPIAGTVGLAVAAPLFWVTPDLEGGLVMALLGIMTTISQFTLIKAYQAASAATVAPFTYTGVVFAAVLGYLAFDHFPDQWTILGAVIITASGLYLLRRGRHELPPGRDQEGGMSTPRGAAAEAPARPAASTSPVASAGRPRRKNPRR
ncbi:MAG: DMT family transporter [Proteobacteria bacterium]|nr:DMT family transporter [Pseudomonadota bacterium]